MFSLILILKIVLIFSTSYEYGDVWSDYSITDFNETFDCLGENRTEIRFNNTGELVPDLWQLRIVSPSYGSQYAVDYLAYLFMREKLGMNVRMWPYPNSPMWYDDVTVTDGITGDSETFTYPDHYWHLLEDDICDLSFENWPIQEESVDATSNYYLPGTVERGYIRTYGEIGWYMPKYFTDAYPDAVVPSRLASDDYLRSMLIGGSNGSYNTTNWYKEYQYQPGVFDSSPHDYSDIRREDFLDVNLTTVCGPNITKTCAFEALNYTVTNNYSYPIVWGSGHSWIMAYYSWNISRNLELNVSFVSVGTEANLLAITTELYAAGAPFVANIYIPDDNFASLANVSAWEYMDFEKVALPFNRGQSVNAECYKQAICANPLEPIGKLMNPLLRDRFPEAASYWNGFEITPDQLAIQQSYYSLISDTSLTEHEKWLNASCSWLKDPSTETTWNAAGWLVDIDRYDCVPGCGVLVEDGSDYIGGTCDYLTNRDTSMGGSGNGTCECDDSRLYGDDCDQSCPGLGTTYNEINNTWELQFCSGHGTCDDINFICTCKDGWGKSDCGTKYDNFQIEIGLSVFIIIFSCLLSIAGILCIVWLRLNAHYKTVKALSVDMTTIMTVGIIFLAASNIPLLSNITDAGCTAWQFLFGLGGIMAIISPLLKAYRVSRVFHGGKMLRAVKITDKMLMKNLLQALGIEVVIVVVYTILHQINGGTEIYFNDEELRKETQCNQHSSTTYISLASYGYFFILLCALTYYSYGTRRALSVFKESTCAYFSSFLSLFCTLIVFGFNAATNDPLFRAAVQSLAIIIVVTEVLIMFYGTRIYTFFTEPENRNVTDGRSIGSTTTTSNLSSSAPRPGPQTA